MVLLAHLSDTHFNMAARNVERAERVMAYLAELPTRPDVIIVTGDIADEGETGEYQQARAALNADVPVVILPGNHDDRANMRTVLFGEDASYAPINQVHSADGVTLVMLDSSIPGRPEGRLDDETLDFLTAALASAPADETIVIGMHHPPVPVCSTVVDHIRLTNPEPLAAIVAADDRIAAILTGHVHAGLVTTFAGKPLIVAPSVSSTIGGEWETAAPGHVPIDFAPDPSLVLHSIKDGQFLTMFRPIALGGWLSEPAE
ncbi:metallophosphoesterase [Nocardia huaxiensis]|uniref:Metallophosphoesterase n=1 Tax=Nocardia huaxiensis TaxID=2755382 RepID=A0A7D6ZEG2_9NOCA|nr:metallophosphoesterase [Nocardia huaxiensis]QLY31698.1 metallophosphoesterase [Nocardia huaxiensis]UFS95254.1 metallophosphoesterase [Nocardia huaxiensis]